MSLPGSAKGAAVTAASALQNCPATTSDNQLDKPNTDSAQARRGRLKSHFDLAVRLVEKKAALSADIAAWRNEVRADGLVPAILFKLAKESVRDAEQRRKAAEAAEIEELYRQGLGLPLFDYATGRQTA
jgi:hypothetical protein